MSSPPKNVKADWVGWSLQFLFGFGLGLFAAYGAAKGRRHPDPIYLWMAPEHAWPFATGAGLLLGGLGSLYGEAMWWESSNQRMPVQNHDHSKISLRLSRVAITFGALLMVLTLLRNFSA